MSRSITRRDFLRTTASAAALFAASPLITFAANGGNPNERNASRTTSDKKIKVIIIGAGLAGLSSAYKLSKMGQFDIVVLEAQDRPGGRIQTLREPFSHGLYADAGAFWICETHTLTLDYIRRFGLTTAQLVPEDKGAQYFFQSQGKMFAVTRPDGLAMDIDSDQPEPDVKNWPNLGEDEEGMGLWSIIGKYFCSDPELIDATAPGWPPKSTDFEKYDKMDFLSFLKEHSRVVLKQQDLPIGAIELIRPWLGWWDDLDKLSALSVIRDGQVTRQLCQEPPPEWFTVVGGMDSVPRSFAAALGSIISYGSQVTALKKKGRSVSVNYSKEGKEHQEEADYLICAIPFSVLKEIDIKDAGFSPQKIDVINKLEYASISRVFLQFKKRIWDRERFNGIVFTDLGRDPGAKQGLCGVNIMDMTVAQDNPRGILSAYISGAHAQKIKAMDERDRLRSFLEQLKKIYPKIDSYYDNHGISKCWDEDRWARGAYPVFRPGQMTAYMPHLATAEDRVYFAGDHTSGRPGWMEGALRSGHRAALEIFKQALRDQRTS